MVDKYKYQGDRRFSIAEFNTTPLRVLSKKESKRIVRDTVREIEELRKRLYAEKKRAVLIVFQAIDAAGKDGTINRLTRGLDCASVQVSSFKKPSEEELAHDFLWRIDRKIPRKGMIGVFNRSHYEEVLVTRVHPEYILYQNLPEVLSVDDIDKSFWTSRFERIKNYEKHLAASGVTIIKFFLKISKDEQERRLIDRMETPEKHWKYNLGDIKERDFWNEYESCFEDMVNETSQPCAPWYVIPADDKNTMRALVVTKVKEELEKLNLEYPKYGGDFEVDKAEGLQRLANQ